MNCGMILRECLRHEVLTKIVFNSNQVYKFFDYVEMNTFDIASDAFATFKVREHPFLGYLLSDKWTDKDGIARFVFFLTIS